MDNPFQHKRIGKNPEYITKLNIFSFRLAEESEFDMVGNQK
jgi:hypothetical protein